MEQHEISACWRGTVHVGGVLYVLEGYCTCWRGTVWRGTVWRGTVRVGGVLFGGVLYMLEGYCTCWRGTVCIHLRVVYILHLHVHVHVIGGGGGGGGIKYVHICLQYGSEKIQIASP